MKRPTRRPSGSRYAAHRLGCLPGDDDSSGCRHRSTDRRKRHSGRTATTPIPNTTLHPIADTFAAELDAAEVAQLKHFWVGGGYGVPREFDGKLIAGGRTGGGRDLTHDEAGNCAGDFESASKRGRD